jgi:hypothetical protein
MFLFSYIIFIENMNVRQDLKRLRTKEKDPPGSENNCLDKSFPLRPGKFTTLKLLVSGLNRSPRKPSTIAPACLKPQKLPP